MVACPQFFRAIVMAEAVNATGTETKLDPTIQVNISEFKIWMEFASFFVCLFLRGPLLMYIIYQKKQERAETNIR